MIKKTNAICVFNIFIDNATYGSRYEEYIYGYGLDTSENQGRDPDLIKFIKELLVNFPEEYFETESLLDDIGSHAVFIEGKPKQNNIDFNVIIKIALEKGFYVTNETNGGLYTPKLKDDL
jgi:hypothetical protein